MRPVTLSGTALTLLAVGGDASQLFPRAQSGDGYISIPVTASKKPQSQNGVEGKRAGAIQATLENEQVFYAIELGIGSPPQKLAVLLDTGSSELWVDPDCSSAPTQDEEQLCESLGQYDPSKSKTPPVGPFGSETLNYGDPSDQSTLTSVDIVYFADTIEIDNAKVKNQTFGVVTKSQNQAQGIMGLAPDLQGGFAGTEPYELLLATMAKEGVIASKAFALDLRDANAASGAVIFGGLDRSKFSGALTKRPLIKGLQGEFRLAVELTSLGITEGTARSLSLSGDNANVLLDSGTTITRMYSEVATPILDALGAQDGGEGYFVVDCALANSGGTVDFGFGGVTVHVPMSDFVLQANPDQCVVGLTLTTDQQILGDTVLRAGYFVFDWDNEAVHIAQADDCGDSDIVAVGSGENAVPDVQGNCKGGAQSSFTAPPSITRTANLPTSAYTTAYTITSCPKFDLSCQTGVVTTETVQPAAGNTASPSSSGSSGGSGSGNGNGGSGGGNQKSAGVRVDALGWASAIFGIVAGACYLLV